MINKVRKAFLSAVFAGLEGRTVNIELAPDEWASFVQCAFGHFLLPMVYESAADSNSFKGVPAKERSRWQKNAAGTAVRQIVQTNEFLTLILHAQARGLDPIVVKGLICRNLYPKPYLRFSVDEDIFIRPEEGAAWHAFLVSEGFSLSKTEMEAERLAEPSYHKENSPLCIELHKYLFPPDSEAFRGLNRYFSDAYERTTTVQVEDVTLKTLLPTDHFLFLLLHAYKHFLHSGFGIRQVMDMAAFIKAYGREIDWAYVKKCCEEVHADVFAAAILKLAAEHLGLPEIPAEFRGLAEGIDTAPLLDDMIEGGIYGVSEITRAHSSNITLEAAEDSKTGRRTILPRTLFPGREYLKMHFSYARRYPLLLPVAWLHRIVRFLVKDRDGSSGNPAETLRIGRERVALLRKYGVIDGR